MYFELQSEECIAKANHVEIEQATMRAIQMDHSIETDELTRRLESCQEECLKLRTREKNLGPRDKKDGKQG